MCFEWRSYIHGFVYPEHKRKTEREREREREKRKETETSNVKLCMNNVVRI